MRVVSAAATDVGRKRDHNEDNLCVVADERLFIVADGMGGHEFGEVASQIAVETVASFFRETSQDDEITWPFKLDDERTYEGNRLSAGIKLANLRIREASSSSESQRKMGTTIVAMHVAGDVAHVAHVGDSRIYRVRGGVFEQITRDHSLWNQYMDSDEEITDEMREYIGRYKNVITRALGMHDSVEVDVFDHDLQTGDLFMLCSDGLTDMLDNDSILGLIDELGGDLDACCTQLVAAANEAGGVDNITVMLVRVDSE